MILVARSPRPQISVYTVAIHPNKEITMKRVLAASVVLSVLCSSALVFGQASIGAKSPFYGTWKLNVAKSKFSPGPPLKSQVAKLEAVEGGLKVVADRVDADGKTTHFEWTAKF